MRKKLFISLFIGGSISALTLYLAFRSVPFSELWTYLGAINYWWIFPTVAIFAITYILRAIRWKVILKNTCEVSFWESFHPIMISFMMNCVLPLRVGELARPVILKQRLKVPMTTGMGTVAAERIFDLFFILVLFTATFSTITAQPDIEASYLGIKINSQSIQSVAAPKLIRLSIALLVFITLLSIRYTRDIIKKVIVSIGQLANRLFPRFQKITHRIIDLFLTIIENFAAGLSLVHNPGQLLKTTVLTILIWGLTALSYAVFALGCPGINLSLMDFTTVMVIICFAISLPSVPGFWGLWEVGGVFALLIFGVNETDALGYTLVNHATQIFPVIIMGLISALITSINFLKLSEPQTIEGHELPAKGD